MDYKTFLEDLVKQIENKPGEQWIEHHFPNTFEDKEGNFYDNSVVCYLARIQNPNRGYRSKEDISAIIGVNYITLHSGEKLDPYYYLAISGNKWVIHCSGTRVEKIFKSISSTTQKNT